MEGRIARLQLTDHTPPLHDERVGSFFDSKTFDKDKLAPELIVDVSWCSSVVSFRPPRSFRRSY